MSAAGPRILVLKTGTTNPQVVADHGDYDDWFIARLPGRREDVTVVPVFDGTPLPRATDFDGVLITGSPLSVRDEAPWMTALAEWTLKVVQAGQPVFGVCFGHQLLGEALGGRVDLNPKGREVGTIEVSLTPEGRAHPLFDGLPDPLVVQSTHNDILLQPPSASGVTLLAGNDSTTWQAFAMGEHLVCVQFHPELTAAPLQQLMDARGWPAVTWDTPHGEKILANWWGMVRDRLSES